MYFKQGFNLLGVLENKFNSYIRIHSLQSDFILLIDSNLEFNEYNLKFFQFNMAWFPLYFENLYWKQVH